MRILGLFLAACLAVLAPAPPAPASPDRGAGRILVIGDSLLAWHKVSRRAVGDVLSERLKAEVVDRSVGGARYNYALPITGAMGLNIARQYTPGRWDWVVVNGGGNDLLFGCGCLDCAATIDRLISADGQRGRIPALVRQLLAGRAKVVFVGYLRTPGVDSPVEHCRGEADLLEARIRRLEGLYQDFHFVSLADLVPHGDRSFHGLDMVHPSVKGSAAIGERVAAVIRAAR